MHPATNIASIATSVPENRARQAELAEWAKRVARANRGDDARSLEGAIDRIYRHSGIAARHSVVPDYTTGPSGFALFPDNWGLTPSPSTADRMEIYRREAPPLACEAAARAIAEASGVAPGDVTHLVVASCTGHFAPGLDAVIVDHLGLRRDVERLVVGFMGCYAAFNALRAADATCRARPDAVVLVVCVELCSLHFQRDATMNNVVANSLFADGAAAMVLRGRDAGANAGCYELVGSRTLLDSGSTDQMTWTVRDEGFQMLLGTEVPSTIGLRVEGFVADVLGHYGIAREAIDFWAIHPGGRRIVEVVGQRLGLGEADLAPTWEVLAEYGNMSSPTVLFVLDRIRTRRPRRGALGLALAFGPGLTLESALLRAC